MLSDYIRLDASKLSDGKYGAESKNLFDLLQSHEHTFMFVRPVCSAKIGNSGDLTQAGSHWYGVDRVCEGNPQNCLTLDSELLQV